MEKTRPIPFLSDLCRHKTDAEIQEAEENFRRYLEVVKEICDDEEHGGLKET